MCLKSQHNNKNNNNNNNNTSDLWWPRSKNHDRTPRSVALVSRTSGPPPTPEGERPTRLRDDREIKRGVVTRLRRVRSSRSSAPSYYEPVYLPGMIMVVSPARAAVLARQPTVIRRCACDVLVGRRRTRVTVDTGASTGMRSAEEQAREWTFADDREARARRDPGSRTPPRRTDRRGPPRRRRRASAPNGPTHGVAPSVRLRPARRCPPPSRSRESGTPRRRDPLPPLAVRSSLSRDAFPPSPTVHRPPPPAAIPSFRRLLSRRTVVPYTHGTV